MGNGIRSFAVTGTIGSGKSTFCQILKKMGYPVIDADNLVAEAHRMPEVQTQISSEIGPVYLPDGSLDRASLRAMILKNENHRKTLEAVIHPVVRTMFLDKQKVFSSVVDSCWIFYEAALIFEAGRENDFESVIVVSSAEDVRIQRLQNSRGMDPDLTRQIVQSQMSDSEKRSRAEFVIENNGTFAELEQQAFGLIRCLIRP